MFGCLWFWTTSAVSAKISVYLRYWTDQYWNRGQGAVRTCSVERHRGMAETQRGWAEGWAGCAEAVRAAFLVGTHKSRKGCGREKVSLGREVVGTMVHWGGMRTWGGGPFLSSQWSQIWLYWFWQNWFWLKFFCQRYMPHGKHVGWVIYMWQTIHHAT